MTLSDLSSDRGQNTSDTRHAPLPNSSDLEIQQSNPPAAV